jgi:hypothetical protein
MIKLDMSQIQQSGDTFFSTYDLGYMIFMLIGIICYFTVPSIADEVVFVGGGGGMQATVNRQFNRTTSAVTMSGWQAYNGMVGDMRGDLNGMMGSGMAGGSSNNYFPDKSSYQHNKLSG